MLNATNPVTFADLSKEATTYFQNIFKEDLESRPRFENLNFKQLLPSQISLLTEPFTEEEIDMAVAACDGNKAPGPDGFNFNFVKTAWDVIKTDVYKTIRTFWDTSQLPKGCNTALIALIPKVETPKGFHDFRPISMVGCVYKIISKVLARRLQQVMEHLVGPLQSSFIKGRQILDGALIASEIIESCKRQKTKATLLKLDFHKAFDSLSWNFLDWVQEQMGFPPKWRSWIKACVMSASASILINGSPTQPIKLHKGLRQGDPLSPFLFNLAVETLNLILMKGCELRLWEGINARPNGIMVTHLQYADDTIIFCPPKLEYLCNIKKSLIAFQIVSGLGVNFHKSALYGINVDNTWLSQAAESLLCRTGSLPFTYLGLPIGGNTTRMAAWDSIIKKMQSKLASWKGNLLSIGGRLTLIKSSLASLPLYFMSIYPIPKGVIEVMVKIQRNFLWSRADGKRALPLVAWARLELPKLLGGLGVGNLLHRNLALLFKWHWRFLTEPKALWRNIIADKYGYGPNFSHNDFSIPRVGGPWKQICKTILNNPITKQFGTRSIRKTVGRGNSTLFWQDLWVGDSVLKSLFPRLFSISTNPLATIDSLGVWDGHIWHWLFTWRRSLRPRDLEERDAMLNLLKSVNLDLSMDDSFAWIPQKDGNFSVKSATFEIAKCSEFSNQDIIRGIWRGLVPHRVEVFVWLSILGKINSRSKLASIGVIPPDQDICGLCQHHSETSSHLFLHCSWAWALWTWWLKLWNLSWVPPSSLKEMFHQWHYIGGTRFFKKIWYASFFIIIWTLWKERNERIFNDSSSSSNNLQNLVLLRLSWWLKAWEEKFPYSASEIIQNPHCLQWMGLEKFRMQIGKPPAQIWSPPPSDQLMWNVDASFDPINNQSAVGGVLRNDCGNFVCLFSSPIPPLEINSAEVFAILRATQITMRSQRIKSHIITIVSDSSNAVQWCNQDSGGPWNLSFMLNFIRNARKSWLSLSIVHKGRGSNSVADSLAKQGLRRSDEFLAWC